MTARRTERLWWAIFAFITWNVVFDRAVAVAGSEFARDQILRYQQGQPTLAIDEAFSPRVARAALTASGWALLVLAAGALVTFRAGRGAASSPTAPDR
jgi:hypothetical protein